MIGAIYARKSIGVTGPSCDPRLKPPRCWSEFNPRLRSKSRLRPTAAGATMRPPQLKPRPGMKESRVRRDVSMAIAPGPRVLSVRQPWAWAIASGHKRVENRTWDTPYRGTVYIPASSNRDANTTEWIRRQFRIEVPADRPRRAIIAVAELTAAVTRKGAKRFSRWFEGPYGFVLNDVRPLRRPVRTLGKLGLFQPSMAVKRSVAKQLGRRGLGNAV